MGKKLSFRVIAELAIGAILLAVVVSQFFTMDRLKTTNVEANTRFATEYDILKARFDGAEFDNELLQEKVKTLKETNFQMQRLLLLPSMPITPLAEASLIHTVVKGDWLSKLAKTYYGDAKRWPEIWGLNPQIANPHLIYVGDLVRIR